GIACSRLAISGTWEAGTNRNSGFGSMKRLINHGQAMRSTRARSRVIHFMSSLLVSRPRSSPPGGRRVQPLDEGHTLRQHLVIVGRRRQESADGDVDAPRLLVRVLAVTEIGLVHHLGESDQTAIPQTRLLHEGLEGTVLSPVTELDARRIEGDRVLREL